MIKDPQMSKSGHVAFVIGESESRNKRPPRLPPIKQSNISHDQINFGQAKAAQRKQVYSGVRSIGLRLIGQFILKTA